MARNETKPSAGQKTSVAAAEPSIPKPGTSTIVKEKPLVHAAEPRRKLSTCTKVKVIHIFCDTLEKINDAYKTLQHKWIRNGEEVPRDEFIELAGTYSDKGGILDWFHRKEDDDNWLFEDVAFSTHAGAITAPFQTDKESYHIILVEARE